jgi:hypothetical protein
MLCVVMAAPLHLRVAASGGRGTWEVAEGWRNLWHAIILWIVDVKRFHGCVPGVRQHLFDLIL